MACEKIDLKDYILTGGDLWVRATTNRDNPALMLKVYPLDWARLAQNEYDRAVGECLLGQ